MNGPKGILGPNDYESQDVVITSWNLGNPNTNLKFKFTMNFKSAQVAMNFLKSVKNVLTEVNSHTDELQGIIDDILGHVVTDVVELGKFLGT